MAPIAAALTLPPRTHSVAGKPSDPFNVVEPMRVVDIEAATRGSGASANKKRKTLRWICGTIVLLIVLGFFATIFTLDQEGMLFKEQTEERGEKGSVHDEDVALCSSALGLMIPC